jgi:hypothetical protein
LGTEIIWGGAFGKTAPHFEADEPFIYNSRYRNKIISSKMASCIK